MPDVQLVIEERGLHQGVSSLGNALLVAAAASHDTGTNTDIYNTQVWKMEIVPARGDSSQDGTTETVVCRSQGSTLSLPPRAP